MNAHENWAVQWGQSEEERNCLLELNSFHLLFQTAIENNSTRYLAGLLCKRGLP